MMERRTTPVNLLAEYYNPKADTPSELETLKRRIEILELLCVDLKSKVEILTS